MDPLSLLRQYVMSGDIQSVHLDAYRVVFKDRACPRNSLTNYKSDASYYPIDAVLFFYQRKHLDWGQYFQECRENKVANINFNHRKDLLNYLAGEIATSSNIDTTNIPTTEWSYFGKRPHEEEVGDGRQDKKMHFEDASIVSQDRDATRRSTVRVSSVDPKTLEILSHERVNTDYRNVLLSESQSFGSVINMINKIKEDLSGKLSPKKPIPSSSSVSSSRPLNRPSSTNSRHPPTSTSAKVPPKSSQGSLTAAQIILVPSVSSLITMLNIEEFLGNKRYITPEVAKENGVKKATSITLKRKLPDGKTQVYEIYDTVALLKPDDWNRVVAVFVAGAEWQFKDYHWQTPVDLFSHVKGFHLAFDDVPLDKNIGKWNVTVLNISRTKRHLDSTAVLKFWNDLDSFLVVHKQKK